MGGGHSTPGPMLGISQDLRAQKYSENAQKRPFLRGIAVFEGEHVRRARLDHRRE
jgi:hypothetical protein